MGLRLRELPAIRERFAAGRISYSKVRAITRIAVPETDALLLRWPQWATGAEVERLISAVRSACRPGDRASGPDRDRSYRSRRNGDGTTTITIRLPDDEAAAVEANLDRLIDLDDPQPSSAEDAPPDPQPSSAEDAPGAASRWAGWSEAFAGDGPWVPDNSAPDPLTRADVATTWPPAVSMLDLVTAVDVLHHELWAPHPPADPLDVAS